MWRYLKAAFLVGVDVPALGRVPINPLVATGFAILGFAQPAFWLAGLAVESTVVFSLAFNSRFQKYVQGQQLQLNRDTDERTRDALIRTLPPDAQRRNAALAEKCDRVLDVYRSQQAEDYIVDSSRESLSRLQWLYLKLLVARHHLTTVDAGEPPQVLAAKIADLERDLQQPGQPDSLRESRSATLAILKKRQENVARRSQTLEEIDSDCTRLEAQVDLLLENASMQGKPETISADIELASNLFGSEVFGEDEQVVSHLDRKYSAAAPRQAASQ